MLKVLFFASVKEQLDCAALDVEWREAVGDLDALQAYLGAERGPQWREVLGQANMVRVNVPAALPIELFHGRCGSIVHALRLRADERMLTVRLVPHGRC